MDLPVKVHRASFEAFRRETAPLPIELLIECGKVVIIEDEHA
jgi:hypothetical protein